MSNAYRNTIVPIYKTQESIKILLVKFGVRGVQFTEDFETGIITVRFAKQYKDQLRTVSVTMKVPEIEQKSNRGRKRTKNNEKDQLAKATYRALHDWLKASFLSIEFGLFTFEDVFLSHFEWLLNGETTTVGNIIKGKLAEQNPQLLLSN